MSDNKKKTNFFSEKNTKTGIKFKINFPNIPKQIS